MESVAKALVMAVQYIAARDASCDADSDVQQLEAIAALLSEASDLELQALRAAAHELGLHDWPEEIGLRA